MKKFKDLEELLNAFNKIHNDKFTYENIKAFESVKQKIMVNCKKHGEYTTTVERHLKSNCRKCSLENVVAESYLKKTNEIDGYKKEFNSIHNNFYNYDFFTEYRGSESLIKIKCPEHGIFKQSFYLHRKGHGCRKCSIEKSIGCSFDYRRDKFKLQFYTKFLDKLELDSNSYINNETVVEYKCTTCNVKYKNTPNKLLNKKNVGCAYCYGNATPQNIFYFEKYKENLIKIDYYIYLLKFKSKINGEDFLKVGISKHEDFNLRFSKELNKYEIEEVKVYNDNKYNCFKIEQLILKEYKQHKYIPKDWFGGASECLDLNILNSVKTSIDLYIFESKY